MSIHTPRIAATLVTLLLLAGAASATTTSKHTSSSHSSSHHTGTYKKTSAHSSKHSSKTHTVTAHSHGQRTIGEDRTREIQEALIREHYLTGEPSGVWDAESKDAMIRYQEANGWQTKVTPDSRALIKLGLGPDHKDLLNPDTADVASPHELGLTHDTLPGGVSQQ
jgi:Putative peptidoglycan binding domain